MTLSPEPVIPRGGVVSRGASGLKETSIPRCISLPPALSRLNGQIVGMVSIFHSPSHKVDQKEVGRGGGVVGWGGDEN